MTPRVSFVAFSLSQLSTIMKRPAKQKPVIARSATQTVASRKSGCTSAAAEATETMAAKARIWPARRTIMGPSRQPTVKPA